MAKTTRRAGKRATAAGRGVVRTRKSGVSKAGKPGLRKQKPAKTDPRKQKSSLRSETARLKRQLKAARMQQEAGAEILRAVANASRDAAGPLQLIAETTARLFEASSVAIQLAEGDEFTQEYRVGASAKRVGSAYPRSNIKVGGRNLPGTVVAENRQIHIPDLDQLDPSMSDFPGLPHARAGGARTVCGTPLRREHKAIGALIVLRDRLLPFTDDELTLQQSFADQAVIAIQNARLFNETKEALERQVATADILRIISRSVTHAAPVFDTILESCQRLFNPYDAAVYLVEGDRVRGVARRGPGVGDWGADSMPLAGSSTGLAIAQRRPLHFPDLADKADLPEEKRNAVRLAGGMSVLYAPIISESRGVGSIVVTRQPKKPFTETEIEFIQSFADQAAIAIENARLFDEVQARTRDLSEALEQQTATSEVLAAISRSPSNLNPVLEAISDTAARLCGSEQTMFFRYDGNVFRILASWNFPPEVHEMLERRPLMPGHPSAIGRAGASLKPVCIPDVLADPDYGLTGEQSRARYRATLAVPLLREGRLIGALSLNRSEPGAFTEKQIELVATFADQAVIAIENVRLFDEVQAKTSDLEESLQQQIATADVLKVISRSAFDLQTVLETLARSAVELSSARRGTVFLRDGDVFRFRAASHPDLNEDWIRFMNGNPQQAGRHSTIGRAIASARSVCTPDVEADPEIRMPTYLAGIRAVLAVPLLRDGKVEGVMALSRQEPGEFTARQIELVETFADQAVIAIENTRLFNETKQALAYQTGSSNVLRVIASSPTDVEPVLKAIVESAQELCEANDAVALLRDAEDLRFSAHSGPIAITLDKWPISRNWTAGRAFVDQKPVHVHDMLSEEGAEFPDARVMGQGTGSTIHTVLSVPLLRGNESIGAILLRRTEVRPFNDKQINLLSAFADQAVIAIQNARLFNETREALERQTATADVLKIIAASPTDVQPVFEAIVQTAVRLLGCETSFIQRCDSSSFWSVARCRKEGLLPLLNPRPGPIDPAANFPSRAMLAKKTLYLPDWSEIELPEFERRIQQELGYNCAIYLPLLHKDECLGVLGIAGSRPRMFSEADIALAEAFRDQAVIAIRNTQLFEEVQQRTHELSQSLEDLRTAQDRLVQTEKLASLGQLTAGIAHEIKNPLNFVNNFSALSAELIDELNETLAPAPLDQKMRGDVGELTQMLKSNLEKVVQHGKRADSIVKNMLLHSREGSGEQRPTDINALLDESLNLAYHGARAEKPGFNITLQRDLDPVTGMADVYPQEITRVLLNLISNGFYAATRRAAESDDGFEPTLRAATKNLGDRIEIRIRDNGTGIAPEVKEKIFNPFFTTKPAGEGTGLGLSMSHDIVVKQHGGTIDVDSEPGIFTEFIINLPRATVTQKAAGGTN